MSSTSTLTKVDLYQPDKFGVTVGEGTVGFCTVWNEPGSVLTRAPELKSKAAIIGTLYSSQGVNVMVRNLARNPWIRTVYLWGNGTLSNTKFGTAGTSALRALWEKGIDKERSVQGTTFKLEKEIEPAVVDKVRANVKLVDLSGADLKEAVSSVAANNEDPYMDPVVFPDAVLETPDIFPSEGVGWAIHGSTVIATWQRLLDRILRYGTVKGTQYGSQQKELIGATWVIDGEDPSKPQLPTDWPASLCEVTGATSEAITEYHNVFLSPDKPSGVSYTYGNRLMRYPAPDKELDQVVDSIIRNLKDSPDSRRAVATTLVPWIDAKSKEPPCLVQVQCLQSNGRLHFLTQFRSHDIFKAAIPNAFGLRALQARIAQETGFEMGALQITSQSAHIYEADWDNAKKLVRCAIWERPARPLSADDADPRGICVVRVAGDHLELDVNGRDGSPLVQLQAKTADQMVRELGKLDLLSQTGHALDIGVQLARAEIALKKGIKFTQDRPLAL